MRAWTACQRERSATTYSATEASRASSRSERLSASMRRFRCVTPQGSTPKPPIRRRAGLRFLQKTKLLSPPFAVHHGPTEEIAMADRVRIPGGEEVVALGQGTWRMGEDRGRRATEIAALRHLRQGVFLVSKVYPHNASRKGVVEACERSLRRLRTDRLDLYLLHWPGSIPLAAA